MARKKPPKYGDVVLVEWVDSCAPGRIWQQIEDVRDYGVLTCISAGFWIKQDKKSLVIAQSMAQSEVGNVKAIPASCIRSMKVLSRAKAR